MPNESFTYDVFISYSHQDEEWVVKTLLPRLEAAGLRVCIDYRDFLAGKVALLNMQDSVKQSRHTVLVITEHWIASEWTSYEAFLSRAKDPAGRHQRTIPLRLGQCELPDSISMLTWVDFYRPDRAEIAWRQLMNSLDVAPTGEPLAGATPTTRIPSAPILNPFSDKGRIHDPERFFVRQRVVRELCEHLHIGNSISLVGDREIGKSSLLWYLYRTQATWRAPHPVVFVNLQSIIDKQDFCKEVLDELNRPAAKPDLRQLKQAVRELQPILLLDEAERLTAKQFRADLQDLLRGFIDDGWITLTVASHAPLEQVFPPSDSTSPLHNACMPYKLEPFSPDEARAFLRVRLDGTEISFTLDEIEHLLAQTGGRPGKLQRAAQALFESKRVANKP